MLIVNQDSSSFDLQIFHLSSTYLTCPCPVPDSAWLSAVLPALLQEVSQCQHASPTKGVGEQQVPALEKRPPEELYPNEKLFTRLRKHVWTAEISLSSVEEKQLPVTFLVKVIFKVLNMESLPGVITVFLIKYLVSVHSRRLEFSYPLSATDIDGCQASKGSYASNMKVSKYKYPISHISQSKNTIIRTRVEHLTCTRTLNGI